MNRILGGTVRAVMAVVVGVSVWLGSSDLDLASAQVKPEGEMRWALYVTMPPPWFDPGEVPLEEVRLKPR